MKTHLLSLFLFFNLCAAAQITTPIIKAGFGVDADLKNNYFNNFTQSGNDDWFSNGNLGTGRYVIDTTGASAVKAGYASDVSPYLKRMTSFYRTMSVPQFSIINNRLWLDAMFIRDYHGTDTTVFTAGADKNGQSPANWSGGVQGIPDKNDILDMYMHVRRAGPTPTDSLWFFGGLSLDNVTGNRYFDFEMYQTDIYYDRASKRWYGYGPDEGHTSWKFDAAGNIISPGDIIFSAEYQSASLTNIEARIWINKADLALTPNAFAWSGLFDGASSGAQFGYASILPKNGGTFYTGLQCGNGEWAGAFSLVLQDNSVVSNYIAKQFMEFSVNLSKLGLDPVTVFGSDICGTPFNRVVVKTRASASFTAELKDFVAPIDLFLAPRVDAVTDVPIYCGQIGVSQITVQNPAGASVYTWTTPNGHIVGTASGTSITVDAPGTYIVKQQLAAGCNPYAYDTVNIVFDATCVPMENSILSFRGTLKNTVANLQWSTNAANSIQYFELERSLDGRSFSTVGRVNTGETATPVADFNATDGLEGIESSFVYYRLRIRTDANTTAYSNMLRLSMVSEEQQLLLFPNPSRNVARLTMYSPKKAELRMRILDVTGALVETRTLLVNAGTNVFSLETARYKKGTYMLQVMTPQGILSRKLVVAH